MRHNHERRINSTILQPAIPMNKLLKAPEWQCLEGFQKHADPVCHCYEVFFEPVASCWKLPTEEHCTPEDGRSVAQCKFLPRRYEIGNGVIRKN